MEVLTGTTKLKGDPKTIANNCFMAAIIYGCFIAFCGMVSRSCHPAASLVAGEERRIVDFGLALTLVWGPAANRPQQTTREGSSEDLSCAMMDTVEEGDAAGTLRDVHDLGCDRRGVRWDWEACRGRHEGLAMCLGVLRCRRTPPLPSTKRSKLKGGDFLSRTSLTLRLSTNSSTKRSPQQLPSSSPSAFPPLRPPQDLARTRRTCDRSRRCLPERWRFNRLPLLADPVWFVSLILQITAFSFSLTLPLSVRWDLGHREAVQGLQPDITELASERAADTQELF